jgi:peptide/nickel transport system substrate-binding protein
MFKLGGSLAAALVLGTALGGAVSAQTLTMGLRAGPDSIDPHWSTLGSQAETLRHIFDTLVMSDENLGLKPGLATSWKPIDETTWEFKIREGVKFHDGSELTAEDVKFSIDRIPVVTGPMSMTIYTKQVAETKVADKYTLHASSSWRNPSAWRPVTSSSTPARPPSAPDRTSSCPGNRRVTSSSSASTATGVQNSPGRR